MEITDGVILPAKGRHPKHLGHRCVMASHPDDAARLAGCMGLDKNRRLLMSRVHFKDGPQNACSLAGPFIGAPYAVILMETLIAWGVREVIMIGWCGAVSERVHIGDVIIPDRAYIDEGTSGHYCQPGIFSSLPSPILQQQLVDSCLAEHIDVHRGSVWTTDAIFRETPEKIAAFQEKQVLGVEMEASALFTVAAFRNVNIGCMLIVSDELSSLKWVPGFKAKRFVEQRERIAALIAGFCA